MLMTLPGSVQKRRGTVLLRVHVRIKVVKLTDVVGIFGQERRQRYREVEETLDVQV